MNPFSTINNLFSRKFSLLTIGEAFSLLGDQFSRIALIWLILDMTGSSSAVGIWLALGALPRAVFLLMGGALADRFSPVAMMIASNLIRAILVIVLAIAAATNAITFAGLCVFTILFGAASALYTPSLPSALPRIVPDSLLQSANSVIQGIMHIANLAGPPAAAFLLAALLSSTGVLPFSAKGQQAYALLFALDALTFFISLWTLFYIGRLSGAAAQKRSSKFFADIFEGLAFVAKHPRLRIFVLIALTANFCIGGPLAVAIPLMAKFSLQQGVVALGALSAAGAAGSILGLSLAAALPQQNDNRIFAMPFIILPALGLLMITLAWANAIERAAITVGAMTTLAVYLDIQALTWLQKTTDRNYLGRVMSILQLGAFGLLPVSMALAGLLGEDLQTLFISFGSAAVVAAVLVGVQARRIATVNART